MTVLLSIKKNYVDQILDNTKTFELRRRFTKEKITKILIYETSPTMRVVGSVKVKNIHNENIKDIWNLTKNKNGVLETEFNEYFKNKDRGVAIELESAVRFVKPKKLSHYNIKYPPQSFQFIR